jgi:nucleoid DNA-binding protein
MSNLSKKELQKLVDSVSLQLTEVLAKAEEVPDPEMAKTTPGNEAPAEKVPEGSSTDGPAEESSSASPDESPAKESTESVPAKEDAPPAVPEGGEGEQDPAQDGGGSVESLQAEYAALPLEELKMHLLACKAALMAQVVQGGGDGAESAPDGAAGDVGADASAAPASATPALPTDGSPVAPEATPENKPPFQKSEADTAILERLAVLEKSLQEKDAVISGFGNIASKLETIFTKRKSAHSIAALGKPGTEMAKSEDGIDISLLKSEQITEKLNEITANGKLSKSDKDAVMSYVAGATKDVSKIAHLLTKKN